MGEKFFAQNFEEFKRKGDLEEHLLHYRQEPALEVNEITLLLEENREKKDVSDGSRNNISLFILELERFGHIAGPLVAVNLSLYFLQTISVMMVGHLGELYLSSTAIAISFCGVTGFSVIVSLSYFPKISL